MGSKNLFAAKSLRMRLGAAIFLFAGLLLSACGDSTATPVPATTTAATLAPNQTVGPAVVPTTATTAATTTASATTAAATLAPNQTVGHATATQEKSNYALNVEKQLQEAKTYFESLDIEKIAQTTGYYMKQDGIESSGVALITNNTQYSRVTRKPGTFGGVIYSFPTPIKYEDGEMKRTTMITGVNLGVIDIEKELQDGRKTSIQVLLVGIAPTTNKADWVILPTLIGANGATGDSSEFATETAKMKPAHSLFNPIGDRKNLSVAELSVSLSQQPNKPNAEFIKELKAGKGLGVEFNYGNLGTTDARAGLGNLEKIYPEWMKALGITPEDMNNNYNHIEAVLNALLISTSKNAQSVVGEWSRFAGLNQNLRNFDALTIDWKSLLDPLSNTTNLFAFLTGNDIRAFSIPSSSNVTNVSP
ncbi:MAG: hypothetical protein WCK19_16015 [Chloroflexota bacterium]